MEISLNINGVDKVMDINPGDMLTEVLRKAGHKEVKRGCDTSNCGLCSVLVDGKLVLSCSYLAAKANGRKVQTVKDFDDEIKKIGTFLRQEGGEQCGFCSPGFLMAVISMKKNLKKPTDDSIREYMQGNLCRCTGYMAQLRAIKNYLEVK